MLLVRELVPPARSQQITLLRAVPSRGGRGRLRAEVPSYVERACGQATVDIAVVCGLMTRQEGREEVEGRRGNKEEREGGQTLLSNSA